MRTIDFQQVSEAARAAIHAAEVIGEKNFRVQRSGPGLFWIYASGTALIEQAMTESMSGALTALKRLKHPYYLTLSFRQDTGMPYVNGPQIHLQVPEVRTLKEVG